ncbi:hypothetical protein DSO57_1034789 [Entomophthora muscae]|uniref:Uncharacterized protein n=1 Tax=Entomophthora muscae TaxID=34485 RepID=A0ACC2REG5_9FUNG|nr:hypothetical protein DSO57_1034789 [Entomophthora muscae]
MDLVVPGSVINLTEDLFAHKRVKKVVNQQQGGVVVGHQLKGPVLLDYKEDCSPVGQEGGTDEALVECVHKVLTDYCLSWVSDNKGDVPWEVTLVVVQHVFQGPECLGQSAGLSRGKKPHSLGTLTKYLPD